jgi:glucose/arabinose dehydrogenase
MARWRVLVPTALVAVISLALSSCGGSDSLPFGLQTEVAANADRARALAFAPDGRLFFGEQYTGAIRILQTDGQVQSEPFAQLTVANYIDLDWGLTGIAIDPDFESNRYVYAFYSEPVSSPEGQNPISRPKLVRFTEEDGRATEETVLIDNFPETVQAHAGFNANGRIHFGEDGMLYLSMGDYDVGGKDAATGVEDPDRPRLSGATEPIGKLLRVNPDGSAPDDNPFSSTAEADPRVYATGFRDPFPFTFHPQTGAIYGTDNTPVSCEELNIITEGGDYGWPDVGDFPFSDCSAGDQVDAIYHFSRENTAAADFLSFVEVSGLAFAPGSRYPTLGDSLFVCESQRSPVGPPGGEQIVTKGVLRRLVLSGTEFNQVSASDVIVKDCKGDLATAADGTLYYANDSEIRRLLPGQSE